MSRKLKKGYFVRGEFIAEGSERDLELKRELKGTDQPSRTELKHASAELQKLGESLLTLRADLMAKLELGDKLADAVSEGKRITSFEGRRRQMQFIGKLMRQADPALLQRVRTALNEQIGGSAQENMMLHEIETWRQRLLESDDAFSHWVTNYPATDTQQLRTLLRQARKDATAEKPGAPARHGRAYREIFQLVRDGLHAAPEQAAGGPRPTAFDPSREAS